MTAGTTLFDAVGRPVRASIAERRLVPETDEVAARGRDDIFLGFIRATGLDATSILLNPDAILQHEARGKGLALYDELLRDAKIGEAMQTRKLAVVGKEWRVLPASDDQRDVEIAEFVKRQLTALPCFHLDLEQAMDAIAKGFTIQEAMWAVKNGDVALVDLRHRDPRRFAFTVGGELRLLTANQPVEGEAVPARKFLHYVFDPRYENPYGEALLSRVYYWWWFKKHAVKFWVIFAEKFGMPTAIGKYPPGATKEQKADLLDALTAMQQEYAITFPDTMKAELLEAQRYGTVNTYQDLCNYCDAQIALAILGQTLTSQVGSEGGSYAAAKVHGDVRQDYVEADAKTLSATIKSSLIPWLVDWNFPPSPAGYPDWVLMVTPEADLLALSERDQRLVLLGLRVPQRYFYETYRIPEPTGADAVIEPPAPQPAFPAADGAPAMLARRTFAEEDVTPAPRAARISEHAEAMYVVVRDRGLGVYASLFDELRRELEAAGTYDAAVRRLPESLSRDERAPLETLLHEALVTAHLAARGTVLEEAEAAGTDVVMHAAALPLEIVEPMPPHEALRWFTSLRPMTVDAFNTLSDRLRATAFRVARVESDALVGAVRDALGRALSDGTPFRDFARDLNGVFDRAGVTRLNPYHAETVFRTNLKTSYEAGRLAQYQDPDVAAFFPFFQYHAVGDARTRPTHRYMSGRVYRTDDPLWLVWYPPCGFNCRCTVTAISAAEAQQRGIRESAPPPASIQPDPGFAGSPMSLLRRAA